MKTITCCIESSGTVTTLAGGSGGTTAGTSNGIGTSATFTYPQSLAIDPTGLILYVGSQSDHQVRQIVISSSECNNVYLLLLYLYYFC